MLCTILGFHGGDYEEREREREREVGGSERNYNEREEKNLSSVLNVPRQCSLVLPVGVKHLTGIIEV
jgi:hypothetical protein